MTVKVPNPNHETTRRSPNMYSATKFCLVTLSARENRQQFWLQSHQCPPFLWDPLSDNVGTWNVRSMNQGKSELVKQEMARVNVDILGISELKWTGMGEFNSDDHYIYYYGQESLRRNRVAIMVNKRV